ncbi:unnamed protein product [Prunus armeniaca]
MFASWYQSGDLGIADSSFKPPAAAIGVDDFFNPHGDASFDLEPEPDLESRSYFDDLDPDYDDSDFDHDSDDDPNPGPNSNDDLDLEFVSDSDLDPDFNFGFGPDSGLDPDPDSYCILCIFRCTDYDFQNNDPDTWMEVL